MVFILIVAGIVYLVQPRTTPSEDAYLCSLSIASSQMSQTDSYRFEIRRDSGGQVSFSAWCMVAQPVPVTVSFKDQQVTAGTWEDLLTLVAREKLMEAPPPRRGIPLLSYFTSDQGSRQMSLAWSDGFSKDIMPGENTWEALRSFCSELAIQVNTGK